MDKPYKCPLCPSAFTRSHHCRGHINSVHKFFKCVTCSALFTTEEDFNKHKELHPALEDQSISETKPKMETNNVETKPINGESYTDEGLGQSDQYWRPTSREGVENSSDYHNGSSDRTRENIALAEFMASMAAQRSAVNISSTAHHERKNVELVNSVSRELAAERPLLYGHYPISNVQYHTGNMYRIPVGAVDQEQNISRNDIINGGMKSLESFLNTIPRFMFTQ